VRRVACYAARSQLIPTESGAAAMRSLIDIVVAWLRSKGFQGPSEGTQTFTLPDNRLATTVFSESAIPDAGIFELSLDEPTEFGLFFTRICFAWRDGALHHVSGAASGG